MKFCADVGGSFTQVAILDDETAILHRERHVTPADDRAAFVEIFRVAQSRHAGLLAPDTPLSIALAALIEPATGLTKSANLPCVDGRVLATDLGAALGRPVVVTNDADCFVLAEAKLGCARGHSRVFGIILGTGVGGGLVLDGRLVTGEGGVSGEWGHGPIITRSRTDPMATPYFPCGCGRWGCLDTVGAARGLERLHHWLHGETVHSRRITAAWEAGDPAAVETIDLYLNLVSGPLATVLNTFPASIVPVGGGLSTCARLVAELDVHVRRGMLKPPSEAMLVATSLGGDAGLLGAALAAEDDSSA